MEVVVAEVEEEEEEEVEVEDSEVLDEVFDFFPFWPLDLEEELVVETDVETVIVTVGASVMVMVTVPEPLSSPDGEAVGRLLSSEVLLVLSSTPEVEAEVEAVGLPSSSEVLLGLSSSSCLPTVVSRRTRASMSSSSGSVTLLSRPLSDK